MTSSAAFVDQSSKEPEWKLIHRIADAHAPGVDDLVLAIIHRQQARLNLDDLAFGFETGRIANELMSLAEWDEDFDALTEPITATLVDAGDQVAARLPNEPQAHKPVAFHKQTIFTLSFDQENPEVQRWLDTRTITLRGGVTKESQGAVRDIISDSYRQGLAPRIAARRIREVVGLNRRQARALLNMQASLLDDARKDRRRALGIVDDTIPVDITRQQQRQIDKLLARRSARMHRLRASTIARNELVLAANKGQELLWLQAQSKGVLPQTQQRIWLITPDERICPICEPMETADPVGLREPWETSVGSLYTPNESHVTCRCSEGLV